MLKPVECVIVVCDSCGRELEGDYIPHFRRDGSEDHYIGDYLDGYGWSVDESYGQIQHRCSECLVPREDADGTN